MSGIGGGVLVCTLTGQWWRVDDLDATPTYVTEQCKKAGWLPVVGPINQATITEAAGYLRSEQVVAVRWEKVQP